MTLSPSRRALLAVAGLGAVVPAVASARAAAQTASSRPAGPFPVTPALPAAFVAPTTGISLDPRSFGAKADGFTKDTGAIQQALDRCAVLGGGEVVIAGGAFLTGAIRIGSNTVLRIMDDGVIQGSPDLADYPVVQIRWEGRWIPGFIGLVWAQQARNVGIAGKGRIQASDSIPGRVQRETGLRHPALLEFHDVHGLSVTDVHTQQNDMWSIHPVYCEDVIFRGVTVNGRADGIDVDSCRRVAIDKCDFDTVDDCISLKSGRGMEGNVIARPTEDVTITDCTFKDLHWACIGIGSETSAGIRRVLVERCKCLEARTFAIYLKSRPGRGAFIEDITMRDMDISGQGTGYGFLRLNFLDSGKQDQFPVAGLDGIPTVRNFWFENIRITEAPILIEAVMIHPDKPLDGLMLKDISGTSGHGITLANMRNVVVENLTVRVFSGPVLAMDNVTGRGLDNAARLIPPAVPAPVVAADRSYRLGMESGRPN